MTHHQSMIMLNLINDPNRVVFLCGEAGVGKTYTISKFIENLDSEASVALCSTTHQALAVLKDFIPEKHNCYIEIGTIHSFTGFVVKESYGRTKLARGARPNSFNQMQADYLIIDEASMMPKIIFDYINSEEFQFRINKKIIYIGDPVQLTVDRFLDLDSLSRHELTENHRLDTDSELYKYCKTLRKSIENKLSVPALPSLAKDIIVTYNHGDFINLYKRDSSEKLILVYKNQTVSSYNNNIKKYMLKEDKFTLGDNLICTEQVTNKDNRVVFNNRERITIVSEPKEIDVDMDGIPVESHLFRAANKHGSTISLTIPKSKTKINEYTKKLASEKNWSSFYRVKAMFNSIHHSCAMTVHSAQGISVDTVFIDMSDFNPPNDPMQLELMRLAFVALTRARHKAIVFLGSTRDYTKFKM